MKAREYEAAHGKDAARKVVDLAGTKWSYWRHFCNNEKRPGSDLARKLVAASELVTPKAPLTLNDLLTPSDELKGRTIQ